VVGVAARNTADEPLHPIPLEEFRLVRAGPKSRIGYRVPSVRRIETPHFAGEGDDTHRLKVTAEVELELVDDLYAGRYVLREITIADAGYIQAKPEGGARVLDRGPGLTPELIRSLPFSTFIMQAAMKGAQAVTIDPQTGRVTDHLAPDDTLSTDDLVVLNWLSAKLCGFDTNKVVAAALEITPAAAAQRIRRLRKAEQLPPATGPGGRR
jgi:hypothetical protein